jgi:uncharacterized protein YdbL (DUF1318 family)
MTTLRFPLAMLLIVFAAACVTINVYFPAEAAEKAADRIIRDVYGEDPVTPAEPQSFNGLRQMSGYQGHALLDWLIAPAHAEADISVDTPAIRQLKAGMEKRHKKLAPYYDSGAVGITQDGQLEIRDQKLVPLKERKAAKQLVSKENRDRVALYREIAQANGHPEWEAEIRGIFARRWVDNARSGWWYMGKSGNWKQK